jgi:putative transposase
LRQNLVEGETLLPAVKWMDDPYHAVRNDDLVLLGDVRFPVRNIIRQVCSEWDMYSIKGVLSSDHVHMFVSVPPRLAVSHLMGLMKGRSSHKVQRKFQYQKWRYWGQQFWGRG